MENTFNDKLKQLDPYVNKATLIYQITMLINGNDIPTQLPKEVSNTIVDVMHWHKQQIISDSKSAYVFLLVVILHSTQKQLTDYIQFVVDKDYLDYLTNIVLLLSTELYSKELRQCYDELLEIMQE